MVRPRATCMPFARYESRLDLLEGIAHDLPVLPRPPGYWRRMTASGYPGIILVGTIPGVVVTSGPTGRHNTDSLMRGGKLP